MSESLRRQIASLRASLRLPPDSASDAIWVERITNGTATFGDAEQRIEAKAQDMGVWSPGTAPYHGGGAPTPTQPSSGVVGTGETGESGGFDYLRAARSLFGYLPTVLIEAYARSWEDTGNAEVALSEMRQHSAYLTHFPGNVRDDGTVRLSEQSYFAEREAFDVELTSYGIPPATLGHLYPQLVEHGVRPEEFRRRMTGIYTNIVTNISSVRDYYAANFGTGELHIQSFMASALDPTVNPVQIERDIRRAQIGGEGAYAGFAIDMDHVTRMQEFGVDQGAAREFFGQARTLLPTLSMLIERHNDPNDEFDIESLSDALVFGDPERRDDISRLFAQEQSLYSPMNLFQVGQGGVVSGLRQR